MHDKISQKTNQNIADLLRTSRESKHMTQQQVADKAGIRLRQYQHFEYCERSLVTASFSITMDVLEALDIDPKYFISKYVVI